MTDALEELDIISIPAPAQGATQGATYQAKADAISIPAPAQGATGHKKQKN